MKAIFNFIGFLISSVIRIIPFIIFLIIHIFWSVYTYQLDPLKLLDVQNIPSLFGEYLWLYMAIGVIIFIFLTLKLHFLAYFTFFGAFIGQNLYFLRAWDNKIFKMGLPDLLYRWFFFIYFGMLIGFILQAIFTGGNKVLKIQKYNKLRRSNSKVKKSE